MNVVPADDGTSEVFKGSYSPTLTSTGSREKYAFDDGEIDESTDDIRGWKIVAASSCHVVATGWCWDDEEEDRSDVTYVFRDATCTCNEGTSSFRMQLRNGDDTVEGTLTKTAYGPFAPGAKVSMVLPSLVGYTAKGLPAGLKFNQKTGTISGVATKPTGDTGVTLDFKDGKEVVESRTCRFFLHGENGDGIGSIIWEFEDGGVCIELHQNIWKVKGFKPLPVFAEKKTVVTKTLDIHGSDGTVGTSTLTLAIDANGAVSATLVEKGVERGKPFHDKYAFKGDLTIDWIESWDGGISFCSAKIPFVIGTTAVMRVDMEMYTGVDGKIHAEGCIITSDFAARGNGE